MFSLSDFVGWRFGPVAKTLVALIALFNMCIVLLAEYTTIGEGGVGWLVGRGWLWGPDGLGAAESAAIGSLLLGRAPPGSCFAFNKSDRSHYSPPKDPSLPLCKPNPPHPYPPHPPKGSIFTDFVGSVSWGVILTVATVTMLYTSYGGLVVSIATGEGLGVFWLGGLVVSIATDGVGVFVEGGGAFGRRG